MGEYPAGTRPREAPLALQPLAAMQCRAFCAAMQRLTPQLPYLGPMHPCVQEAYIGKRPADGPVAPQLYTYGTASLVDGAQVFLAKP